MVSEASARVLDGASRLFAERGYQATTTRAIAEAAGVNEVTVFRAFGNKQGILRAIGERLAQSQVARVAGALPPTDARSTLLRLAHQEVANGLADGGLVTRLAFEAGSVAEVAEVFGGGPQANLQGLTDFLAQAQRAGELRDDMPAQTIAEAFFSLTSSFVIMRTVLGTGIEEPAVLEKTVNDLFQLFWCGAAPAEPIQEKK